jgi:hypothetical protein
MPHDLWEREDLLDPRYRYCAFGWHIWHRGAGSTAFDDGVGQASGAWVLGRPPASAPGLMVYVMVDSVAATLDAIADRRGCARDHCAVSRPGRKRDRAVPATGVGATALAGLRQLH